MFIALPYSLAVIPGFVYRRVILRGTWDHARSMLLGPRVLDGSNGFHLITPLVRPNGSTILVDRGFISEHAAAKKRYPTPDGDVEVYGMLRESQARNNFTPDNKPVTGEWYWADVTAMAEYAGGESFNVQPVLVEEIFGEFFLRNPSRVITTANRGSCWRRCYASVKWCSNRQSTYRRHTECARLVCSHLVGTGLPCLRFMLTVHRYSLSALTTVMFIRLLLKQRRTSARLPRQ